MIFVDVTSVRVQAGNGGDGIVSFRREPYVDRGGPDGGNGGDGGNVVLVADRNINTLTDFRYIPLLTAQEGGSGARAKRHGKKGESLSRKVPVGTMVFDVDGDLIADLTEDGMELIVAHGGKGGFGNAHFTSSVRQAPNFAEKGEPGESGEFMLEVKMIADVGLIGLPNAGKSTFLAAISNARPEIADYPFTTLSPNLGVCDVDDDALLVADVPGLIEGASEGKGLGDEFLRHVERTATLIHMIDVYSNDIAHDYKVIMNELASYKVDLTQRPMIVALTKVENVDDEIIEMQRSELAKVAPKASVFAISSLSRQGVDELLRAAKQHVQVWREEVELQRANNDESVTADGVRRVTLPDNRADTWRINQEAPGIVRVTGAKIERFARRTDFTNDQAVARIRDIMHKMGIMRELRRLGVEPESKIYIGRSDHFVINY